MFMGAIVPTESIKYGTGNFSSRVFPGWLSRISADAKRTWNERWLYWRQYSQSNLIWKCALAPLATPRMTTSSIWKNTDKVTVIRNVSANDFACYCARLVYLRVVCNASTLKAPQFAAFVAEYAVPVHGG